jgi:hypothetical protein
MAKHLNQKRAREGNEEAQAMADKKRPRKENEEASNWASSSSIVQAQQQPEEKTVRGYSSSINLFHRLRDRELGINRKLLNVYRDYHFQSFAIARRSIGSIRDLVIADDIICAIDSATSIVPFIRNGDQFWAYANDDGSFLFIRFPFKINFVCYNNHKYSLIIVLTEFDDPRRIRNRLRIISLEIPFIKARITRTENKQLFQGESIINDCEFDIPNCRGVIYNLAEGKFKVFELKKYTHLFTIPDIGMSPDGSYFKFRSPGNMDMVIYERIWEGFLMRIYSKRNGKPLKQFILPRYHGYRTEFIAPCGSDRILVQQYSLGMDVVDISSENPTVLKKTNIRAASEPYYLD